MKEELNMEYILEMWKWMKKTTEQLRVVFYYSLFEPFFVDFTHIWKKTAYLRNHSTTISFYLDISWEMVKSNSSNLFIDPIFLTKVLYPHDNGSDYDERNCDSNRRCIIFFSFNLVFVLYYHCIIA